MKFLTNTHKENYINLINLSNIHIGDLERKSLFYIIAGNIDLFKKKEYIYDFSKNCIDTDSLISDEVDFCFSSKALIRLGFNLYNGYNDNYTTPLYLLGSLDSDNYTIANDAINLRFSKQTFI